MVATLKDQFEQRLRHPVHQAAFAYWDSRRRLTAGVPGRRDIDPVDIPGLLPWINLIEVHRFPEGLRYRHRLIGTGIVQMRARDSTGQWIHDIQVDERRRRIERILETTVRTAQPALYCDDLGDTGKPYRRLTSLILPLASNRRCVDMVMAVAQYE